MHRQHRSHAKRRRVYWLLKRKQSEIPMAISIQERDRRSKESCMVREEDVANTK